MPRHLAVSSVLVLACLLPACATAPSRSVPTDRAVDHAADLESRADASIAAHVDSTTLAAWYDSLPAGSLEREAARWILAWLPPSDRVALDAVTLQEHVAVACRTRRTAPWRDQLPHDLWLRYVVPHRVSQEPVQPWRGVMARALAPLVSGCATMEEAALAVNRWCRQQATYTPTSGRDMGPLTTIARGLGRCEEEMILTICALRAAGLPARSCSTPYWTFTDDNHAWVEVWADGRWHYAESCDDRTCLDDAWFSGPASRAGFVRSMAYGEFDPAPEPLYRSENGVTIVNSTGVYTEPFTLAAAVAGAPAADVFVNVLNYGTLRAIARMAPGRTLDLGPGEYAVTAADPSDGALLLRVVRGEPGGTVTVQLDSDDRYDLVASPPFWLHYPEAGVRPPRRLDLVPAEVMARHRDLVAMRDAERTKLRSLDAQEQALLDSLPAPLRARWVEILEKPHASGSVWVRLLSWAGDSGRRDALTALLSAADDKDLLEWDERVVRAHVDGALAVRRAVEAAWGLAVPDSIWREGVLTARIAREPGCDWRAPLPSWPLAGTADATMADWVDRFRRRVEIVDGGPLGQPLAPHRTWRLGAATRTDLEVCFVGLCRRAGVPARWRHGHVEIWTGDWSPVAPLPPQEEPDGAGPAGRGWLDVSLTRGGLPDPDAEPYRRFMVAEPGDGVLEHRWWDVDQGGQEWDTGRFVLGAVTRVPGGSACGRLRAFTVTADETTRVALPLDIDPAGWDRSALVDADLIEPLQRALASLAGRVPALSPDRAIWILAHPGEGLARTLTSAGRVWPRLSRNGFVLRTIVVGNADAGPWRERLEVAGMPGESLAIVDDGRVESFLMEDAGGGPVVAAREDALGWLFLASGLDNELDHNLQLGLDR